ncbi:3-dehydroquinate synthase [Rhizosaccharibacter radicis]|uniref:Multifunctional fusion protein n=1 Tax=Rhizosaccharibacter radicis TaxID=2782605 RepID=A0ABT1VVK0_9PROT|nr:3-dehydroquinate synthase [Acetobacteraceae bacterium KSS12]
MSRFPAETPPAEAAPPADAARTAPEAPRAAGHPEGKAAATAAPDGLAGRAPPIGGGSGSRPIAGGRPVVLVGLMGAGKTTVGRRLAALLDRPFVDADAEIERAAGIGIADIFERYGEAEFRRGERQVIRRLLAGPPVVLATGGGAFMDDETRRAIRQNAVSVWLRCPLNTLLRRVAGRTHRPLLNQGNPRDILSALMERRHPVYAEADVIVDCSEEGVEQTTRAVAGALEEWRPPARVPVSLRDHRYDVVVGHGLLRRAGALLAPVLPQKRVAVIADEQVASLHLAALEHGLQQAGIRFHTVTVPGGERSKNIGEFGRLAESLLAAGIERRTTVVAFGGGVIGDLAGFVASATLRGLPFVQIPTTLLSQVDSSVGGKTGINTRQGKNLLGAFHQPIMVLADTDVLGTLPGRELRAGYAEVVKAGLISEPELFAWCERHGSALLQGDPALLAEAVQRACRFKAAVVGADEREEKTDGGRVLLNLGHTFAHALEAEMNYDGRLLHGEAVSIGLVLALDLSVRLGDCPPAALERLRAHLTATGMPDGLRGLTGQSPPLEAERLIGHMAGDKKMRDGRLSFVLVRGIGQAFTRNDVPPALVREVLEAAGAT